MGNYKNKLFFFGFCVCWSAIHSWILQQWGYSVEAAWADSLVSNGLLTICCIINIYGLRYYLPNTERLSYMLVTSLIFSLLWAAAARYLLPLVADDTTVALFSDTLYLRTAIAWLILGCVIMINMLWRTLEEQKENEKRKNEAEQIAINAELYKLRQQLQPHFLFNSLNSISALVGTQPEEARKMIQQLSDYLRSTLKKEEHTWVSLGEELEYLQLYLDIENIRFSNRLTVKITCVNTNEQTKLPALLLQPVVENAIKFGLYDTLGEVVITITASLQDKMLALRVENPHDPVTGKARAGTGFGLSSIQRRLQLLFARADLLATETTNTTFVTLIKIPQQ